MRFQKPANATRAGGFTERTKKKSQTNLGIQRQRRTHRPADIVKINHYNYLLSPNDLIMASSKIQRMSTHSPSNMFHRDEVE